MRRLINTLSITGQAGVMIRYQGNVSVFRAVVPRPGDAPKFDFPEQTVVDKHTAKKWKELGIAPADAELSRHEPDVPDWGSLPPAAEKMVRVRKSRTSPTVIPSHG